EGGEHLRVQFVLVLEGVGMEKRDIRQWGVHFTGQGEEAGVDLHAQHGAGLLGQADGQTASAAADFEHNIVFGQLGGTQDQIEQVEVDEKILPQLVLGLDAALLQQVAQV